MAVVEFRYSYTVLFSIGKAESCFIATASISYPLNQLCLMNQR